MQELRKTIEISPREAEFIRKLLETEPSCEAECLGEDATIAHTADFGDGIEIDVKICGVQFDDNAESNKPWTEAVLFDNGSEALVTEVSEDYFGDWEIEYKDTKYIVTVREKSGVDFPSTMKKALKKKGISMAALGGMINVSHIMIARYASGKTVPRADVFCQICSILDILPEYVSWDYIERKKDKKEEEREEKEEEE